MRLGVAVFGIASVASGILDLIWGELEPAHQPLQAWGDHIPGMTIFAYVVAVWLIVGGAAILWRKSLRFGAATLTILYGIFMLFPLPRFVTAPHYLGYAGSVARHLQAPINTNTLDTVLAPTANAQSNSFFPDFARGGTYMISEGATNYNGLQLELTKRWSSGLSLEANYTWSKCLGDARDQLDNDIGSYRAPYVPGAGIQFDYGYCDTNVRNIFHTSGVYALPFGAGHTWLPHGPAAAIAGGWSLQWIATVQDGQPFTVGCSETTAAGLGCNALRVPGENPYAGPHDAQQFLNPAAFANPASTATGLAALGGSPTQVTGPAYRKLDLSLFREIGLVKGTRLQIRAEAFNVTNTPNFSVPGGLNFTSPATFASITSTRDNSRELQLAAKFYW